MSTQKRKDSSRANGAKSRGPVTPEGLARSRVARLTHGLTSDQLLIEGESEERFNALREEYLAEYQPQTRSRFDLVDQLVAARWRHNRVLALQTALIDRQITRQEPEIREEYEVCDGETRAAIAYQHLIDDGSALESLNRHETRLGAELRRTMKQLDTPPKNQKFHHEPSDVKPPSSDDDGPAPGAPPSTIDHPPSTSLDDPAGESPRIPPPVSTGNEQRATSGAPLTRPTIDPPPSTSLDDPAGESPRIPPPVSTGNEQRATSGAPLARPTIDPPPSTSLDDPAGESPRIPPPVSTGNEQRATSGAPLARPTSITTYVQ